MGIAIVGIGIHPFGRHAGVSGRRQAAHAAREALRDAGCGWADMQFAFGGSTAAGNADALVADLGLTGIEFVNVANGCATGGSTLAMADRAIRSGAYDIGMAVGFDAHPRGAFNADPASLGLGAWYGETGLMLTTQFFGMKIQRYMHEHGISASALGKVAAKAFRNGSLNPNAWRRTPLSEEEILASKMVNHPLTQYMFCSPGEGAVALVLCRAEKAREHAGAPVYLRSAELRTRRFGSFEVFSPWLALERADSPSVDAARAAFESAGIGPNEVDVAQIQDTESGAEIIHMAECGLCKHGEQEQLLRSGATEIGGALPVNTDGGCIANGEPIGASGLRQVYENVLQLRGAAGPRQVPGDPKVAFTHVYGAPGVSACTVLTT
jgi:acetyl-CoA acetyltransferase